jgi:hypothetical protein
MQDHHRDARQRSAATPEFGDLGVLGSSLASFLFCFCSGGTKKATERFFVAASLE